MVQYFAIENIGFKNTPNLNYEERLIPCHPPKSVVRGKTRVLVKISAIYFRQPEFDFLVGRAVLSLDA